MYHHFLHVPCNMTLLPVLSLLVPIYKYYYLGVASMCWNTYLFLGSNIGWSCQDASECWLVVKIQRMWCGFRPHWVYKAWVEWRCRSMWWECENAACQISRMYWAYESPMYRNAIRLCDLRTLKQSLQNDLKCLPTGTCQVLGIRLYLCLITNVRCM